MLRRLAPRGAHVELVLTRDREIARLNAAYLYSSGPTNCLAFPDASPAARMLPAGTLFLSLDALRRECLLYGQEPAHHLHRLLAHGLAHLVGFEHSPEMDEICAVLEDFCR